MTQRSDAMALSGLQLAQAEMDAGSTAHHAVGRPLLGDRLTADSGAGGDALVALRGIRKSFGPTIANDDLDVSVAAGEVLGLIGANGAGKSTLMRILCGVTEPDAGSIDIAGHSVDPAHHSPSGAHALGIRIVYQELSLCSNLTVAENFFLEQPDRSRLQPFWRGSYRDLARRSIEAVFPDSRIDVDANVGDLSIGELQMVEIARAASAADLKLLILDEPTSSLDAERSRQLRAYIRSRAAAGLGIIFISHKLGEVLDVADRVVVMRNGRIALEIQAAASSVADLVAAMSGTALAEAEALGRAARDRQPLSDAEVKVRIGGEFTGTLGHRLELRSGEIVGLAGLEGSGQKTLLRAIFAARGGAGDTIACDGRVSFVSGDRQREGIFPLWSVLHNIALGRIARRKALADVSDRQEREVTTAWAERLSLDPSRFPAGIVDLSGGNQQKALMARALVDEADVILLDDPTRGVDIASKREFYRLFDETARSGRLIVWHSTEDPEFLECDRVLVFSGGRIVRELAGPEISEDAIVEASFAHETKASAIAATQPRRFTWRADNLFKLVPFLSLALVFGGMTALNPLVASSFGLDLLLGPAVALVLLALAQMFIVGGSEIDLGVGAFAGYVNVVSATLLVDAPLVGAAALLGGLLGYAFMAVLIQARRIPAIVVTLGAAFIWTGFGQTLQPTPGGSSPEWLSALFRWSIPGVPTPLLLILAAALVAVAIDRSRLGTVLRGFGNSAATLERSGWSAFRYGIVRYLIAALFAMAAGLFMTAANSASDINAGASFTLLTVAAVVIGGCQLLGGVIAPAGVAAGAVTLSLIGALLAFLGVSTDFNAAVQGALLIAMLGLRRLIDWSGRNA